MYNAPQMSRWITFFLFRFRFEEYELGAVANVWYNSHGGGNLNVYNCNGKALPYGIVPYEHLLI